MDEAHLITAIRYVSLNPVRAGLVARAEDWPWSSAGAHLAGKDDALAGVRPVSRRVADFGALIGPDPGDEEGFARLRALEHTGFPLAAADFVADLERRLGRPIARRSPGRKPKPRDHPAML
ncbi:MAG: hypothetical protein ACREHV_17855 [Rhizomicrobium sp.]